jgi:hypothetical protein
LSYIFARQTALNHLRNSVAQSLRETSSGPTWTKCLRFNTRKNEFLFRDTMLTLIGSPNREYKHLTAKVQDAA